MGILFLVLAVGTIMTQIPNILGMYAHVEGQLDWTQAAKITLLTLPLTIVATFSFIYFYGRGSEHFSYPAMSIFAKVASLVAALLVQIMFLKMHEYNWVEIIGLSVAVIGIILSICSKDILKAMSI